MPKQPVNVIICGGGARFAALLGGYQALDGLGFDVQRIMALSVGGLIAGPLAAELPAQQVKSLALETDMMSYMEARNLGERVELLGRGGIFTIDRVVAMLDKQILNFDAPRRNFGGLRPLKFSYAQHLDPAATRLTVRVRSDPRGQGGPLRLWMDQIRMIAADAQGGGGKHATTSVHGILQRLETLDLPGDLARALKADGVEPRQADRIALSMNVMKTCGLGMAQPIGIGPHFVDKTTPLLEALPKSVGSRNRRIYDGSMPERIPRDAAFYLKDGTADPTPVIVFAMQQRNKLSPEQQAKQDAADYPDKVIVRLSTDGVGLNQYKIATPPVRAALFDHAGKAAAEQLDSPRAQEYLERRGRESAGLYTSASLRDLRSGEQHLR